MEKKSPKFKGFVYPVTSRNNSGVYNPYLDNFISSTENFVWYLNKDLPSNKGILNIFKYITKIDCLFLNWIEDLPDKKGGIVQSIIFLGLLRVIKLFKVKLIWTLHNKVSHSSNKLYFKKKIFSAMLKRSDLILTHSIEGISFAESLCPGISSRIFYFPHPIVPVSSLPTEVPEKKYDILIWGSLAPYKAIDNFLEFLSKNDLADRFRILIAGKAVSLEFLGTIMKYESENIIIRDQFIENAELAVLMHQSKAVLFTYAGDSVLSSGALIDSISLGAAVIGPNVGAFAELGELGIISTYNTMEDLKILLDQVDQSDPQVIRAKTKEFIDSHTWSEFSKVFEKRLNTV